MTIIELLSEKSILDIEVGEKSCRFTEGCDSYFTYDLSKDELKSLINELTEIYLKLEDQK